MECFLAFLLFFLLVAVSTTAVADVFADVFEGAEWLRDPAFDGVKVIGIQHKQQTERPAPGRPAQRPYLVSQGGDAVGQTYSRAPVHHGG